MKHEFEVVGLWSSSPGSGYTREALRCKHCHEGKVGELVPGPERGAYGPYGDSTNGRDTCYSDEERAEIDRVAAERRTAWEAKQAIETAERDARVAAIVADGSISIEQARRIWEAGYACGSDRGAGGESFEQALGELDE